jgi:hypothetical protein
LAIELAAAHARFVGPDQLLDRLDRALGDARVRDRPARQQTIQATLDWSLDLCTEDEQRLLGTVSVFAGGFDLEAVEVVAGPTVADPAVALDGLVEQSLVIADRAGYVLKDRLADVAVLVDALRRIVEGECVVDPTIVSRLVHRPRDPSPLDQLSEREREVLGLIAGSTRQPCWQKER